MKFVFLYQRKMLFQQEKISVSNNNNIGKFEFYFYLLAWIGGVFYSIYNVFLVSQGLY